MVKVIQNLMNFSTTRHNNKIRKSPSRPARRTPLPHESTQLAPSVFEELLQQRRRALERTQLRQARQLFLSSEYRGQGAPASKIRKRRAGRRVAAEVSAGVSGEEEGNGEVGEGEEERRLDVLMGRLEIREDREDLEIRELKEREDVDMGGVE
ncbi:hypothetical protein RUND412_001766 [Rhizina undulata]